MSRDGLVDEWPALQQELKELREFKAKHVNVICPLRHISEAAKNELDYQESVLKTMQGLFGVMHFAAINDANFAGAGHFVGDDLQAIDWKLETDSFRVHFYIYTKKSGVCVYESHAMLRLDTHARASAYVHRILADFVTGRLGVE